MLKTVSVTVYGKVQGVWFRQSTKEKAIALGLTGWVQNIEDGAVQIVVSGEPGILNEFLEWCSKGPPKARVDNIIVEELNTHSFDHFTIRHG